MYCKAGYGYVTLNNVDRCEACEVRTFKVAAGNTACVPCTDGLTTDGTGATQCTEGECFISSKFIIKKLEIKFVLFQTITFD